MSPSSPCYATLYEEWLIKYQTFSKTFGNTGSTENETDEKSRIDRAITTQVARLVPLLADKNLSPIFLHQVITDMDRESSSLLLLPIENLENLTVSDDDYGRENDMEDMNNSDAFFDMYPECVRDDSESDDGDDLELEEPRNKKIPVAPSALPQSNGASVSLETELSVEHPPPARPRNPYVPQKEHTIDNHASRGGLAVAPQHHHHHPQNRSDAYTRITAMEHHANSKVRDASQHHPTWDSITNVHNPFQSAAHYHFKCPDEHDKSDQENRNQHSLTNQAPSRKPVETEILLPSQKNIPDSLKRKFQPPKKAQESSKKRLPLGVQGSNPSTRTHEKESSVDDHDLPEALRGLDKELIDKIENEILDSGETVTFDDIAGLEHAKATVQELVCWPMKRPDLFTGLRRGPNGLLLYGPPGTGKTLIGKAVAHESGATFFSISSSSLTSKWIGEGEKLVRTLFAVAVYREPAVVFIDEIDSLLTQRKSDENEASRRIKTEFLVQLDGTGGCKGRVLVIGATNRPHELDDAARRRFVKRLYIPLPVAQDRESLIRTLLGKNHHSLTDACISKLAVATDGFSGADLKALCVEAAMGPLRELGVRALQVDAKDVPHISYKHFRKALRGMNPSVSQADLEVYVEWTKTYGSLRTNSFHEGEDTDDGE